MPCLLHTWSKQEIKGICQENNKDNIFYISKLLEFYNVLFPTLKECFRYCFPFVLLFIFCFPVTEATSTY